jgi:hypothetical protein
LPAPAVGRGWLQAMAIKPEISPELRDLIDRHIRSIDEVEVLLCLYHSKGESLAAQAVAAKCNKPEADVGEDLRELTDSGFLVYDRFEDTYSYSVRNVAVNNAVEQLAHLYNERPVSLIHAIYERPSSSVRNFAEAFRFRRS